MVGYQGNIDLNKGKIHIPGTKRSNARKLDLKRVQTNLLRQYLEHDRAILQKKINCYTEALFSLNSTRYNSMTHDICNKLKMINLRVTNFRQIRSSVITLWTEKHDLRRVQIMAGHRYISSTEKYQKTDLKSLYEAITQYHPLQ
ncbi:tyrosine-type recombinase/integrase [Jejuia spongiicola]|uniref:tyrosine-type recombinase/integrase n=1 Tax=Jejuia spongiicola TaxID=2942207 RepID=UPI003D351CC4